MKKSTKKFLMGAATLVWSLSIGAAGQESVHAAVNPARYGIDVFPSRQNHYRFAYQLRNKGHNGHVYYAKRNGKLGRTLFSHGDLNHDYADYMQRHYPHWFRSVVNHLKRTPKRAKRTAQRKRKVRKNQRFTKRDAQKQTVRRGNHKIRRIRRNVKKPAKLLLSKFIRSDNQRALERSGFMDAHPIGGNFIFNKYAPNDRRAVVPKKFNGTNWVKGSFGQRDPSTYTYIVKQHGWKLDK